jgi:hypothetical protein
MTYRTTYGYPWRWAIAAELAWRLEHTPTGPLARAGYRWRKAAERRGSPFIRGTPSGTPRHQPDTPRAPGMITRSTHHE